MCVITEMMRQICSTLMSAADLSVRHHVYMSCTHPLSSTHWLYIRAPYAVGRIKVLVLVYKANISITCT